MFQFRIEATNVFNIVNLMNPGHELRGSCDVREDPQRAQHAPDSAGRPRVVLDRRPRDRLERDGFSRAICRWRADALSLAPVHGDGKAVSLRGPSSSTATGSHLATRAELSAARKNATPLAA